MFEKLAKSIAANAAGYKSKLACSLAIARAKRAWSRAGSYGNAKYLLDRAIAACQDRWQELHGLEAESRYLQSLQPIGQGPAGVVDVA